jgi:UDP-N-acetylglucosamine 2-epimerase (non-hydrolysing)
MLTYKTMANAVNPYGDGRAAQRTAKAIEHMFGFGGRPVPFGNGTTTGG